MIAPRLYELLVRLHPRAFRERFGQEMLGVFEESDTAPSPSLFADCLISLMRQWVLRSGYWPVVVAGLGALALMMLAGAASSTAAHLALRAFFANTSTAEGSPPTEASLLLIAGMLTAVLLGLTALAVALGRRSAEVRRSAHLRIGARQ
jgi:hypothetical protein